MKKILLSFLAGILVMAIPTAFALTKIFPDVALDQWYSHAIESVAEKGIMKGYDDKIFGLSNDVNRAELAVMFDRLIKYQQTMNENCGRLDTFMEYPWFSTLNQKYTNEFLKPLNIAGDVSALYGKGCFTNNPDLLVFMPGQDAHGCHGIYQYDIHKNTLKKAPFTSPYCANIFTNITADYVGFSGSESEGGECHQHTGKYYFKENRIESSARAC